MLTMSFAQESEKVHSIQAHLHNAWSLEWLPGLPVVEDRVGTLCGDLSDRI